MIKAEMLLGLDRKIKFAVLSDTPMQENDAREFQGAEGFSIPVYGFHDFNCDYRVGGRWLHTWYCFSPTAKRG